jgi:hypothetical protein
MGEFTHPLEKLRDLPAPEKIRAAERLIRNAHFIVDPDYAFWGEVAGYLNDIAHVPELTGQRERDWRLFNGALVMADGICEPGDDPDGWTVTGAWVMPAPGPGALVTQVAQILAEGIEPHPDGPLQAIDPDRYVITDMDEHPDDENLIPGFEAAIGLGCPDGGTCHHGCSDRARCYRVEWAMPLSGVYPGDVWPDEVTAAHERTDGRL